ncbi:MAG: DNA translocase FtsK [Hyphomicrobium sp.]
MATRVRKDKYERFLPENVEARLLGFGAHIAGFVLFIITAFMWISLLTWSVNDLSLTHPFGYSSQNAAGTLGAIVSDILLQMLGLGALISLLSPMIWCLELIQGRNVRDFRTKALFYPLVILFFCAGFSTLPLFKDWPLPHGLGGFLGDGMSDLLQSLFIPFLNTKAISIISGILLFSNGFLALLYSIGYDFRTILMDIQKKCFSKVPSSKKIQKTRPNSDYQNKTFISQFLSYLPAALFFEPIKSSRQEFSYSKNIDEISLNFSRPSSDTQSIPYDQREGDLAFENEPISSVESVSNIAARFAANFDPISQLRPGTQEGEEILLDDIESSRSIAARFTPFANRVNEVSEVEKIEEVSDLAVEDGLYDEKKENLTPQPLIRQHSPQHPPLTLLNRAASPRSVSDTSLSLMKGIAKQLEDVLADYGIKGEMRDIKPGPVVTLYEFEPIRGTKTARVIALSDDVARSMSVVSVRAAVVPGRNVIGLEIPNSKREPVYLREMLETENFQSSKAILPLALGKSIGGEPVIADLARMPHLLVAGTTGSGKSVGVNAMILSLLYRLSPEECRFIMIDPKMLELSVYNGIPHLLTPVVTDPQKAVAALGWAVTEMEERYKRMAALSVRNIEAFNQRVKTAKERGERLERTVQTGFDRTTGAPRYETQEIDACPMPYIVIVVDEFADLMMVAGKEIEQAVQRLAQMARAAGLHLIMATQRPSVDVITGTIKGNFPTRISFKVTSKIDSRTILNEQGAEQLLGQGDMLYSTGAGLLTRVHGPFVSDQEVEAVSTFLGRQAQPIFVEGITETSEDNRNNESGSDGRMSSEDDLYEKAREIVLRDRKASTSYVQRRLSIGYNRAADIIERMEREKLISPANAVGKREILVGSH